MSLKIVVSPSRASMLHCEFEAPGKFVHAEVLALLRVLRQCIAEKKWHAAYMASREIEKRLMSDEPLVVRSRNDALKDSYYPFA